MDERILAIEPIRHVAREGVALTPDQLNVLASVMPERLRRLVLLGGTIGARASELYTLSEDQLELDTKPEPLMRVWRSTLGNKSRKEKAIPLTPNETRLFREQLLARPNGTALVFPRPVRNGVHRERLPEGRLAKRSQARSSRLARGAQPHRRRSTVFDGFHVHDLRHTAISLMCRAGYRPEWVAERVGHNDGGALILRNYRHLYPSEMSAAGSNLDALLESPRADRAAAGPNTGQMQSRPELATAAASRRAKAALLLGKRRTVADCRLGSIGPRSGSSPTRGVLG